VTIVVPAWTISQVLDLEVFEIARKTRDACRIEEWVRTTPIPEIAEADLSIGDGNSNYGGATGDAGT
jgi:hypothetical protein